MCSETSNQKSNHHHDHDHDHDHNQGHNDEAPAWKSKILLLAALFILVIMLVLEFGFKIEAPKPVAVLIWGIAYLLSGYQVLVLAYRKALRLDFFNEFFLMSVATIGAFAIGSFSEGVAVMVFYSIGEWFQDSAVDQAKKSIKALLDIRPDTVTLRKNGTDSLVAPETVVVGDIIHLKAGEKVALDAILSKGNSSFNTAALTGESKPDTKNTGDQVLAGMINLNNAVELTVTALFRDSKLNQILQMVQDATSRKSKTQLFISRFARIYTPVVFALAILVVFIPFFFVPSYNFQDWLYRGLVFLVISCPCALVVSIPLGYFGGIGLASKHGILFKGANFLDIISTVDTIVMDKTGTLTKGVFQVQKITAVSGDEKELLHLVANLERNSSHPIAMAIVNYAGPDLEFTNVDSTEIAGKGLRGLVNGKNILAGNSSLLDQFNIAYPPALKEEEETIILVSIDQHYAGYLLIADEIKADAATAISDMHAKGLKTVMLSGDKQAVVYKIASLLGIDEAYGDLLPEDKVQHLERLKKEGRRIAFAGDGINDAPVVALADAGIAMGGLGSDATIETADIVIQNDQPGKIVTAIHIGKLTKKIVWQNIALAIIIKVIVLILGAGGIATLWEAVIADVGVALLAILNAVRIQRIKF